MKNTWFRILLHDLDSVCTYCNKPDGFYPAGTEITSEYWAYSRCFLTITTNSARAPLTVLPHKYDLSSLANTVWKVLHIIFHF